MKGKQITYKYSFNSGLLKREGIKNRIQRFCFHKDIKFELTESKGFIQSTLLYEFIGSSEAIKELQVFFEGLLNPYKIRLEQHKANKILQNYGKVLEEPLYNSVFIQLSECRSAGSLKDSFEDIKDAIKQTLLISTDQTLRQALVDGYGLLGSFILEEKYERLINLLAIENKDLSQKDKEERDKLIIDVGDYIEEARNLLGQEIFEFQQANFV